MQKTLQLKLALTASLSGIMVYLNALIVPIAVLFCVMIADYITGMAAAWHKGNINSRKGMSGIIRKLGYFMLICVGIGCDYILLSSMEKLGYNTHDIFTISILITVWLIINELISILENLAKIDVPIPEFLTKLINKLKISVDKRN